MIALFFGLITWAQANVCEIRTDAMSAPFADRSLSLELPNDKDLLMVGTEEISNEDRITLGDLILNKRGENGDELLKKANEILEKYPEALKQAEENLKFLRGRKEIDPEYFVSVLATQNELDASLKLANQLFLQEFVLTSQSSPEVAENWRKILLLTIGAPFYLRASSPDLFGPEELTPINGSANENGKRAEPAQPPLPPILIPPPPPSPSPNGARPTDAQPPAPPTAAAPTPAPAPVVPTPTPAPVPEPNATPAPEPAHGPDVEDLRKKAEQATQKLVRSLHDNPQTLKSFRPYIPMLKPGSSFVRGKSDAQIHAYILKRTWSPARAETRVWLDAQLKYIRAAQGQTSTKAPAEKPQVTKGPPEEKKVPAEDKKVPSEDKKVPLTPARLNALAKGLFVQVAQHGMSGALFMKKMNLTPVSTALQHGCTLSQPR